MGNGSIFPYHLTCVRWRGGTQERAIRRRVVVPMQGRRRFRGIKHPDSREPMPKGAQAPAKGFVSRLPRKAPRLGRGVTVPQSDTGGRRVASGARVIYGEGTRQNDPVTSEEGVPLVGKGVHSKPNPAAENRVKRLFSKNTGVC